MNRSRGGNLHLGVYQSAGSESAHTHFSFGVFFFFFSVNRPDCESTSHVFVLWSLICKFPLLGYFLFSQRTSTRLPDKSYEQASSNHLRINCRANLLTFVC